MDRDAVEIGDRQEDVAALLGGGDGKLDAGDLAGLLGGLLKR